MDNRKRHPSEMSDEELVSERAVLMREINQREADKNRAAHEERRRKARGLAGDTP